MDEKILKAASELVETIEKYLKQAVSRSILCLKLAALKEALQEERPAEWSEEDEKMLKAFLHKVEVCDLLTNKENVWIVKKLKSFRPQPKQECREVDEDFFFDEVLKVYDDNNKYPPRSEEELTMLETIARHFYELGRNTKNEENG